MAANKKRPSRLGRGLSSLMATPVEVDPVPIDAGQVEPPSLVDTTPAESPGSKQDVGEQDDGPGSKPGNPGSHTSFSDSDGGESRPALISVPVASIRPNRHQPRQTFDESALKGLADSIRRDGLMQPIVVRPIAGDESDGGGYELIAGERRWRAAQIAGLGRVPALVREVTDEQSAELALIENLQREDLNPIEKAEAFKQLADRFDLPHAKIAERVGLERSTVSNLMRLLSLSDFCRGLVREDLLSMGQARAIAGLPDPVAQKSLAQKAVRQGMSVRQVEDQVRKVLQSSSPETSPASPRGKSNSLADMEKQISEQLGTHVKLKAGRKKGTGTMAVDFYSLDQFDELLDRLGVKVK